MPVISVSIRAWNHICFSVIFPRLIRKNRDIGLPNIPSGMGNV